MSHYVRPRETGPPKEPTLCQWCQSAPATDEHHVARGSSRQVSDPYPELKLDLCRDCHTTIEAQKDQRPIGLALLVIVGKAGIGRIMDLYWKVTARKWPDERTVRKWIKRLQRTTVNQWQ